MNGRLSSKNIRTMKLNGPRNMEGKLIDGGTLDRVPPVDIVLENDLTCSAVETYF